MENCIFKKIARTTIVGPTQFFTIPGTPIVKSSGQREWLQITANFNDDQVAGITAALGIAMDTNGSLVIGYLTAGSPTLYISRAKHGDLVAYQFFSGIGTGTNPPGFAFVTEGILTTEEQQV